MLIKMLASVKGHKKDEVVDMDRDAALKYIELGVAEEEKDVPLGQEIAELHKSIGELKSGLVKEISDSIKSANTIKVPAMARDDSNKNIGDWLYMLRKGDYQTLENKYGSKALVHADDGTAGGYVVPDMFDSSLLNVISQASIVRPRAKLIPMVSKHYEFPQASLTQTVGEGETCLNYGASASWTGDNETKPETAPKFETLKLEAHEISAILPVSNTLEQDSPASLATMLNDALINTIVAKSDYAYFFGNGVAKPKGFAVSNACITVPRTDASHVRFDDIGNMVAKLLPLFGGNFVWYIHPTVLPELFRLNVGDENSNPVTPIWIPSAREGVPATLFGYPVVKTELCKPLGIEGDVILADLNQYVLGERQQIVIAKSEHAEFRTNKSLWRAIYRVDGQSRLSAPIDLYGSGAGELSSFIKLGDAEGG